MELNGQLAIWTFSIIAWYQQSFGIIWQLAHMKNLKFFTCEIFFLMGRGIKQAIWTFSIITCYQQSSGIIWQLAHMKNLNLLKIVKNFAPICASVMCVLLRIMRHQIVLDLPLCILSGEGGYTVPDDGGLGRGAGRDGTWILEGKFADQKLGGLLVSLDLLRAMEPGLYLWGFLIPPVAVAVEALVANWFVYWRFNFIFQSRKRLYIHKCPSVS